MINELSDTDDISDVYRLVLNEVGKVVIGYDEVLEDILIALLSKGHVMLEGVPGIGKTFLANILSKTLGCEFKRIQFTPDLLPADIIGTTIWDPNRGEFHLKKGPIFTNILLADEINRAPPKTQSALLESMQERQVTIEGVTHKLSEPFIVLSTQNPIEMEGTYPLPEAQVDRFMFKLLLDYTSKEDEIKILETKLSGELPEINTIIPIDLIISLQKETKRVHITKELMAYIIEIVDRTRKQPEVLLGASPRASIALLDSSRSRSVLYGRDFVIPDDIKSLAHSVLRHRILLKPESELEGANVEDIISKILTDVPVPK
ncbi:MAG: magnesium chelatase [Candidatus Altiarchaeales archaeon]|nr:MAG: magnesium chelatase [Candidatus Altiarchaeales archaeon]